jgi:ketosteroid isomerase-like protein
MDFTSSKGFRISWRANQIDVAPDGEHAHAIGEFELSMQDDQGNTIRDKGKFFDAFEKQSDGRWLCTIGSCNSDLSAEG